MFVNLKWFINTMTMIATGFVQNAKYQLIIGDGYRSNQKIKT